MRPIFKTIFGSHLYGTNNEKSDKDFKGVFIASIDDIILKKDVEVVNETTKEGEGRIHGLRNKANDTETEMKELRRFLYDCLTGQTYALDMIFAPDTYWLEVDPIWLSLIANRKRLLSKNVEPYIGYCRTQAGKYGLKGSRLGELLRVITFLKQFDPKLRVKDILPQLKESEFVKSVEQTYDRKYAKGPITEYYLEILGKKFEHNKFLKDVMPSLELMNEKYGERARMAERNEGVDWKAVSHAFRCCMQLEELATTGYIRFPLKEREFLKQVKTGQVDYNDVQKVLPMYMDRAIKAVENSTILPEKPDLLWWDNFVLEVYKNR